MVLLILPFVLLVAVGLALVLLKLRPRSFRLKATVDPVVSGLLEFKRATFLRLLLPGGSGCRPGVFVGGRWWVSVAAG